MKLAAVNEQDELATQRLSTAVQTPTDRHTPTHKHTNTQTHTFVPHCGLLLHIHNVTQWF